MADNTEKKKISKGKKIKFALFTLLFLLVILFVLAEVAFYFMKYPSSYDRMQKVSYTQAKWWTCDTINGPRYVAHQATLDDSVYFLREIWYYKRLKMINSDGYHDKDEFTPLSPDSDSIKILAAGDSFTWGASSDVGSSFVDILESDVNKVHPALVWNTGIPATGTNHAVFTTKKYLPLQHSNYVVLGFYVGNDFGDNMLPFDRIIFNKMASCYSQYDFDKNLNPVKITNREAYKIATGSYPMEELNFFQKILIHSRTRYFISELGKKISNRLSGNKEKTKEIGYKLTRDYLNELNTYVKANNAELVVLVIPSLDDVKKKEENYTNALELLKELNIQYVDPLDQLTIADYLTIDGGHWHNSGHIKAGHLLSAYLLNHIKSKSQTDFKQKASK
ncbi:MAG TPA: hypothetical protein DCQ97_11200 [Chitinophagaceae bacterium]|nr:hypothetical protein [Chitinophagaceae bacterium]